MPTLIPSSLRLQEADQARRLPRCCHDRLSGFNASLDVRDHTLHTAFQTSDSKKTVSSFQIPNQCFTHSFNGHLPSVYTAATFHTLLVPLIYFFIQHKVHKVKGAYSYYAIFEWSLVLVDVLFDAWGVEEVKKLQIQVVLLEGGDRTMGDDKRKYVP